MKITNVWHLYFNLDENIYFLFNYSMKYSKFQSWYHEIYIFVLISLISYQTQKNLILMMEYSQLIPIQAFIMVQLLKDYSML